MTQLRPWLISFAVFAVTLVAFAVFASALIERVGLSAVSRSSSCLGPSPLSCSSGTSMLITFDYWAWWD